MHSKILLSEAELGRILSTAKSYQKDDAYPEGRSRAGLLIEDLAHEGSTLAADALNDAHKAIIQLANGDLSGMRRLLNPNDSMPGMRIDDKYHIRHVKTSDETLPERYSNSIKIITAHMDEAARIITHDRLSKEIDWEASAELYRKVYEADKIKEAMNPTWQQKIAGGATTNIKTH